MLQNIYFSFFDLKKIEIIGFGTLRKEFFDSFLFHLLHVKEVALGSNEFHIPIVASLLLSGFKDIAPNELLDELSPLRGSLQCSDLTFGSQLSNLPHYRMILFSMLRLKGKLKNY